MRNSGFQYNPQKLKIRTQRQKNELLLHTYKASKKLDQRQPLYIPQNSHKQIKQRKWNRLMTQPKIIKTERKQTQQLQQKYHNATNLFTAKPYYSLQWRSQHSRKNLQGASSQRLKYCQRHQIRQNNISNRKLERLNRQNDIEQDFLQPSKTKQEKIIEKRRKQQQKKNKNFIKERRICFSNKHKIKDSQNYKEQRYQLHPRVNNFLRNYFQAINSSSKRWESVLNNKTCDLKELDLSSKDQFKIGAKIEQLTKLELPHLKTLNIQNNLIKDEGLRILCDKANLPSLEKINLEDNGITLSGVSTLIQNKWDQKVKYELSSVQQNEKFRLHVGEHIPLIKNIIETKTACQIDQLIPTSQNKKLNALNLLLVTPLDQSFEKTLIQESKRLQQKYISLSHQKSPIPQLMLAFKQCFGDSLKFTTKAGLKTNLTSKILFTGIVEERIKFSHRFQHLQDFKFSDFKGNHKKLKQFQAWYFNHLKKQYGVNTVDMTVDSVVEGSIIVYASDSLVRMMDQNRKYLQEVSDEVQAFFFESLHLNQNQFDFDKNFEFPKTKKGSVQKRGGLPYYQPVNGIRFGIKVLDLYQDNNWLKMDGNKEQWAVVFHGINFPTSIVKNDNNKDVTKLRSIFDGRQKGIMLRQGNAQFYQLGKCIKSNQTIGKGIYVSPYFLVCLFEYSTILRSEKYHIVLQCRAKPASIKISKDKMTYWVLNKRQDLRPYGVILFTDQEYKQFLKISGSPYISHKQIYGAQFTSQSWKNIYQKQYNQFHK